MPQDAPVESGWACGSLKTRETRPIFREWQPATDGMQMGWTSGDGGRAKVVAEHRERREFAGGVTRETIAHHACGTEDWFQVRVSNTDGVRTRYIYVMVWEDGWHKEMSEEMHPYYYG